VVYVVTSQFLCVRVRPVQLATCGRCWLAGLLNSTLNIFGELFYRMNFGFREAETQTWKFRSIPKRRQRGIPRQFVSLKPPQQYDLESLLAPYRI